MAKASAQVTLFYVIDIKATYRYYLLQSSTLSAPTMPTVYPPDSSWDDTEPTYEEGGYTNQLPISIDSNGSVYNGVGYLNDKRLSSSGAVADLYNASAGWGVSGFIPANSNSRIRVRNVTINPNSSDAGSIRWCAYDAEFNFLGTQSYNNLLTSENYGNCELDENGYVTAFYMMNQNYDFSNTAYIRLVSETHFTADSIITVDEEISGGSTNSLYFVDCTVFTDGSFSYSKVSLSSSYEAAKQAYNKAANAQDTVDNLEQEMDANNSSIETKIVETATSIENNCNEIILSALESYVETSEYEEFKERLTELYVTPEGLDLKISNINTTLGELTDDVNSELNELRKHFTFTENGILISAGGSSMSLRLDNDAIMFEKNGTLFGWWDGIDFHTGNIVVDVSERAQFGNFAYVPRSDGSLAFLKVENNVGFYHRYSSDTLKLYGVNAYLEGSTLVFEDITGTLANNTLTLGG